MSSVGRALAAALSTWLLGAAALLGMTLLFGPAARADVALAGPPSIVDPHFVRLQIDAISPSTVTSATTGPVIVQGRLINDGDRDVRNLQVRLERAPAVQSTTELRSALRSDLTDASTQSPFVTFSTLLSPGQSAPFSLSLPLSGSASTTLGLSEPGVYPMLVNVNGVPDYGDRARLDGGHFLLPVLSLPPSPMTPTSPQQKPAPPPGVTVLWPLADRPRLLPSAPGSPPLLRDDDLARSLAGGGRLDGLLTAVEQRTGPAVDPTGALAASLCLAVDPDLLVTVEAMILGYQVAGVGGATTPGAGGPVAAAWLDRLKAVSTQRCVVALPWAHADLNALSRASLNQLEATAVGPGPDVVAKALGLPPLPNLTWPAGGLLAERTATDLRALGTKAVLVSADGVTTASGAPLSPSTRTAQLPAGPASLGVALIDAPSAIALADTGPSQQRQLRIQDALGAIAWPALSAAQGARAGSDPASSAPSSVLVAPPQVWGISAGEGQTLLKQVSALLQSGAARPQSLTTVLAGVDASSTRAALSYPVQASTSEVPTAATAAITGVSADIRGFDGAIKQDPQSGLSPAELLAPLQFGLLRAASAPPAGVAAGGASNPQIDAVRRALSRLLDTVSVQAPGGIYTLASAQSPLLLVVRNDLPVSVNVRLTVDAPAGLRATDVGIQQLPARSGRQLQVPTSVSRTGQFAVDVSLATDTGQPLGEPIRLQVRSTAYGPATALTTAGAALVLLALVARRLWHRFHGQPDRADDGRVRG